MATKPSKLSRAKIPQSTQLKLWVLSAGRCEFPGCPKFLLKDDLTLKEDNYSNIAHIISYEKNGPRGHEVLSGALSKDFSNLMLLCTTHHKLIDGRNKADYPVELLRLFKTRHEERIKIQTEIQPDHTTTVLRFMSNIGGQPIAIPISQAYQAIYPNYPSDEKGITIDLTSTDISDDQSYWRLMAKQIENEVKKHFSVGNNNSKISRVSVFAIGAIPLLIQLGHSIGNIVPMDIYQRHRDTQDWTWKSAVLEGNEYVITETEKKSAIDVALILSLSGKIHSEEINHIVNGNFAKYEISIANPRVEYLQTSTQIEQFRNLYRETLTKIREKHGHDSRIHLFPAIPAPIAIICGKELLSSDPKLIIYQKQQDDKEFTSVLDIRRNGNS